VSRLVSTPVRPPGLVLAASAALAVILGLVAGRQPALAVAGAVAVACVALMLGALPAGVALFTVLMFFPLAGVAKAAGLLLALSWVAAVALGRARPALLAHRPAITGALALFVAWTALSTVWARRPDLASGAVFTLVLSSALFPIVFTAVRAPRHARWVCAAFVAGALMSALIGLATASGSEPGDEGRLAAPGINSNQLGGYLAVAAILAVALACDRELPAPRRTACAGAAVLCLPLLLLTGSRGALLGLAVALVAAPFAAPAGRRGGAAGLAVAAVLFGVVCFVTIAPGPVVQRIAHADTSGSGRTDIWRMGVRMVAAQPFTGVGAGNFSVATVDYLLRPGATKRAVYIVDEPKVAHNIYLEVLAELGLPGLALFAAIAGGGLFAARTAVHRAAGRGRRETELLARGLLLALLAMLASAFSSSELFNKQLWLLLALAVALRSIASEPRTSGL
jgi:O-antigen ligase